MRVYYNIFWSRALQLELSEIYDCKEPFTALTF